MMAATHGATNNPKSLTKQEFLELTSLKIESKEQTQARAKREQTRQCMGGNFQIRLRDNRRFNEKHKGNLDEGVMKDLVELSLTLKS
jgi:hypothetical protein